MLEWFRETEESPIDPERRERKEGKGDEKCCFPERPKKCLRRQRSWGIGEILQESGEVPGGEIVDSQIQEDQNGRSDLGRGSSRYAGNEKVLGIGVRNELEKQAENSETDTLGLSGGQMTNERSDAPKKENLKKGYVSEGTRGLGSSDYDTEIREACC
ncbi:MAG: hypothetical protein MI919_36115 [Holophagales bacterium]|nr:hypothetical protein [Holophagales bacterium]